MKLFIYISTCLFFLSCENQKSSTSVEKQMRFNLYSYLDSTKRGSLFSLKIYEGSGVDSIAIFAENLNVFNYKYLSDSFGNYRICNKEIITTHSLKDTLVHSLHEKCDTYPPFQNEHVAYRNSKVYRENGKSYKIFHFIEENGTHFNTYDSYYLENIGPICYYSFDTDEYIVCDSLNGFKINSSILKSLNDQLLNDSTFFSRYFLNKALPNYHRPSFQ